MKQTSFYLHTLQSLGSSVGTLDLLAHVISNQIYISEENAEKLEYLMPETQQQTRVAEPCLQDGWIQIVLGRVVALFLGHKSYLLSGPEEWQRKEKAKLNLPNRVLMT